MVADKLKSDESVLEVLKTDPDGMGSLIYEIAFRSAGVFLWAVWAVKLILDGCCHHERVQDLWSRLDEVPDELEQLFAAMLNRIPSSYRREGLRYLRLALYWQYVDTLGHLSLEAVELALWAYAAKVEETFVDLSKDQIPSDYEEQKLRQLSARLHRATQGLLEETDGAIHFMHRTVADFLEEDGGGFLTDAFGNQQDTDFFPSVAATYACAMQIRVEVERSKIPDDDLLGGLFAQVAAVPEPPPWNDQAALISRVCGICAARPYWGQAFWDATLCDGNEVYLPDKLPEYVLRLLEGSPGFVAGIMCAPGNSEPPGEPPRRLKILLDCRVLDPFAKYQVPLNLLEALDERESALKWHLWELALWQVFHLFCQLVPDFPHYLFDTLDSLDLMVEFTENIAASSAVPEEMAQAMDVGAEYPTVRHVMSLVLDAGCPGHHRCEEIVGTLRTCDCKEALAFQEELHRILQKLEDRDTHKPQVSLGESDPE